MRTKGMAVLLCVMVFSACAQTRTVKTGIYEDRRTGVALRKEVNKEAIPFAMGHSHPVEFRAEDLKYLLKSIRYKEKGLFDWSEARQVFTAYGLYHLTPYLLEGFARATPDDEVLFHLTTVKQGRLFGSEGFTNGTMFVKEGKLNCLFANVDIRPDITDIYDGSPRNHYAGALWKLVPNDWQNLVEGVKGTHYNWIEIDIEQGLLEKQKMRERALKELIRRQRSATPTEQKKESEWEDWVPGRPLEGDALNRYR